MTTFSSDGEAWRAEPGCAASAEPERYQLTLYVSGASSMSARAISNARTLCELHLRDRYQLTIVDLYEDPSLLVGARVIAAPSLVRTAPLPVRMIVGDLSHTAKVLDTLQLQADGHTSRSGG